MRLAPSVRLDARVLPPQEGGVCLERVLSPRERRPRLEREVDELPRDRPVNLDKLLRTVIAFRPS